MIEPSTIRDVRVIKVMNSKVTIDKEICNSDAHLGKEDHCDKTGSLWSMNIDNGLCDTTYDLMT